MSKWRIVKAESIGDRKEQQDRAVFFQREGSVPALMVVADGVGGHCGGAMASQTVVEVAQELWNSSLKESIDPVIFLKRLCDRSHEAIQHLAKSTPFDPRATIVALLISRDEVFWTHIGDSRLYRFKDGKLLSRTKDHSVLQILVDQGKVKEEDMGTHPDQGKLLQSLGGKSEISFEVEKAGRNYADSYLLCTDGFWERIRPEEMAAVVRDPDSLLYLQSAVNQAVKRSNGKSDNVAAIAAVSTARRVAAAPPTEITKIFEKPREFGSGTLFPYSWLENKGNHLELIASIVFASLLFGLVGLWFFHNKGKFDNGGSKSEVSIIQVANQPQENPQKNLPENPPTDEKGDPKKGMEGKEKRQESQPPSGIPTHPNTVKKPDSKDAPPGDSPAKPEGDNHNSVQEVEWLPLRQDPRSGTTYLSMSKHEITKGLYNFIMSSDSERSGDENEYPVSGITAEDAINFCARYTKVLQGRGEMTWIDLPDFADFELALSMQYPLGLNSERGRVLQTSNLSGGRLRKVTSAPSDMDFQGIIGNASEFVWLRHPPFHPQAIAIVGGHAGWGNHLHGLFDPFFVFDNRYYPLEFRGFRIVKKTNTTHP